MKTTVDDFRPVPDDDELPLFSARPTPSAEAAAKQTPAKVEGHKLQIMLVLERLGPLTDEDIAKHTDLGLNTVRPRRGELVRAGLVRAVDEDGRTRTGSRATRWGVA